MSRGLWRRLVLLLAVAGALFFWRGGLGVLPVDRTITWRLWGSAADVREVEVQLYDADALLKRERFELPRGALAEPVSKLPLKKGDYLARVLIWRADGGEPEVKSQTLHVDEGSADFSAP